MTYISYKLYICHGYIYVYMSMTFVCRYEMLFTLYSHFVHVNSMKYPYMVRENWKRWEEKEKGEGRRNHVRVKEKEEMRHREGNTEGKEERDRDRASQGPKVRELVRVTKKQFCLCFCL